MEIAMIFKKKWNHLKVFFSYCNFFHTEKRKKKVGYKLYHNVMCVK